LSILNGINASIVTIHGLIVVPKLLPKNGPSGTYSQRCMSRAKQIKRKHSKIETNKSYPTNHSLTSYQIYVHVHWPFLLAFPIDFPFHQQRMPFPIRNPLLLMLYVLVVLLNINKYHFSMLTNIHLDTSVHWVDVTVCQTLQHC
jgi:hypothetical protein